MNLKNNFDKDKLFFTSDPHFNHAGIIEYCNRPWGDVRTMDGALIANWNKVVPEDGVVFLLGDLVWTSRIEWVRELISKLNGTIYHILGNHCYQNRLDRPIIADIFDGRSMDVANIKVLDDELDDGYMKIFMSHYPHMSWPKNSVHLHGHVHSGPKSTSNEKIPYHPMRYDVGVDNNNYYPISYHELKVILTKKQLGYA